MASNPMKRQARNSFLLGMLAAVVVAALIIGFLFMQLNNTNKQLQAELSSSISVKVLAQDVKSGDIITSSMFKPADAKTTSVPTNYVDIDTIIGAYSLYTKDGVRILSRYEDGVQSLYLDDNENPNQQTKVKIDPETGRYYTGSDESKNFIETTEAPVIAKVDMPANTIVTQSMIGRSDEVDKNDTRMQEYNMLALPIDLITGDYVDIRLMVPSGQDYIVVSKKRVTIPVANGAYLSDTIQIKMSEDEILSLSSAIVEAYMLEGSKLYATKYTEAGIQEVSIPTYIASDPVVQQMKVNPNILSQARAELNSRYNEGLKSMRNEYLKKELDENGQKDAISEKMDKSITSSQESRQEYLQTLVPDVQ